MNELRLQSELHTSARDDNVYLVTTLCVDNEPVADFAIYATFLLELEQSTLASGHYFLLTCWCGMPECVGIYRAVQVRHDGDVIKWVWVEPEPQRTFTFAAASYRRAVKEGIAQIQQDVKDLWTEGVEAKEQHLEIVPNFDTSLLQPADRKKSKRQHHSR